MGRKRFPGLRERAGIWHIEKQIFGRKIHESTGTGDLKKAELMLARRIEEVRQAKVFGRRPTRTFREAATRFLEENLALRSIGDYATHLKKMDPYIGSVALEQVHLGTLKPFIEDRQAAGLKHKSINLALSVIRRILNLAARLWRDESGHTWVETAPLIQLLPTTDARKPYPISTRKVLLGHRNGDITSHCSAPELAELLEAASRVCAGESGKTPAVILLRQKALIEASITA